MMPMAIHYVHIHICRAMHRRRYKNFHITKYWKWNENFTDFLWAPACCAASAPFSKRKGFSAAERAQKQREGRASASTQLENWIFFSKFSSDLDEQLQLRPLKSYVNRVRNCETSCVRCCCALRARHPMRCRAIARMELRTCELTMDRWRPLQAAILQIADFFAAKLAKPAPTQAETLETITSCM